MLPLFSYLNINDLPDAMKCLLADDSIVYNNIISVTDCKMIQPDFDTLCLWSKNYEMEFNANKRKILTETNKKKCN